MPFEQAETEQHPDMPFVVRLVTAVLQAIALYLLMEAAAPVRVWPATEPRLFEPLLLIACYAPLVVLLGIGRLGTRALISWTAAAAAILAGLGYHDAARERFILNQFMLPWPWFRLWLALSAGLFVANVLVTDTCLERRLIPPYPRHFDTAWKQGFQLAFTLVFVGLFWGVLELGASLFSLIHIEFLRDLLRHRWFYVPATTLAVAASLHVTDVQPALIRGARSIALTLFSWLLPLLALIVAGFLFSLPFVSIELLWRTHFATSLLLYTQILLIFLINCWYQDGGEDQADFKVKRFAAVAGAFALPVLNGLAIWALGLRVRQYGWSEERVLAAAMIVLTACYAVGYAVSAPWRPIKLRRLEIANFASAYLVLTLILALFSPLADPARLMVADQVARLRSGVISADKFDFAALKFDGARWGKNALDELTKDQTIADAGQVNVKAFKALAQQNRFGGLQPVTAAELTDHIRVVPKDHPIPDGLLAAIQNSFAPQIRPPCAVGRNTCILRFLALRPGEPEAALFLDQFMNHLFEQKGDGKWEMTANLNGLLSCPSTRHELEEGQIALAPHDLPDLVIGDQRLTFIPQGTGCH